MLKTIKASKQIILFVFSQTSLNFESLPKEYLMDLGYVSPMLTVQDLRTLTNLDFDVLQRFSHFTWTDEQVVYT